MASLDAGCWIPACAGMTTTNDRYLPDQALFLGRQIDFFWAYSW